MEVEAAIDSAARSLGLQALNPTQREAIRTFASGRDVFVALHTGQFCFVLLPLVLDRILGCSGSIMLCVSPLTSLMMAAGEVSATWHIVYSSMSSYLRYLPNLHTAATSYKGANYIAGSARGHFSSAPPPAHAQIYTFGEGSGNQTTESRYVQTCS